MFNNKFDQDRREVCPEIEKIRHVNGAYSIVDLFTYFRAFSNIF